MSIRETKTLTVSIDAPFRSVFDDLSDPITHPEWAVSFFHGRAERQEDGEIVANVPRMGGPVRIKVNSHLTSGVVDVFLAPEGGEYGSPIPVRLLENETGVDVLWTLSRPPGIPDTAWTEGLSSMREELQNLKARHENVS